MGTKQLKMSMNGASTSAMEFSVNLQMAFITGSVTLMESLMMLLMELSMALEISLEMFMKTLERPLMTLQMISVESSMALTTQIKTIVKILRLPHSCQLDPKKYQLLCHRSSPDQRKSSSVYPLTNYFIK